MRKRALYKNIMLVCAGAFLLGLLPYLWTLLPAHLLVFSEQGVSLSPQAYDFISGIWKFFLNYYPHMLTVYIIMTAALIFFEGQNPDRTILWLLTLAFLPVIGLVLYMLVGPDRRQIRNRKLFKPTKAYPCVSETLAECTPVELRKMAILSFRSAKSEVLQQVRIKMLIDGDETFGEIKLRLREAKRYINIEYFIIKDDALGEEIREILEDRARAGVKVRLAFDGVGSWKLGRKYIESLRKAGAEVKTFMPVSFPFFHSSLNFRNHRKIIAVDGDYAFTGGLNIGDEYMGRGPLGYWRDTHAMFEGEAVKALNSIFIEDWNLCAGTSLDPDSPEFAPTDPAAAAKMPLTPMQVVSSAANHPWRSIEQAFFSIITEARERVWLTTPYLVPGQSMTKALTVAALSGVDVRILIPEKADHFLVYWAGRYNIENLLRAGVRIWRYKKGFVHAKTALMDGSVVSVGTANLDTRSFEINFEVQCFIYSEELNSQFAEQFVKDAGYSEECVLSAWENRPLRHKALESLGRLWSSQI